MKGCGSRSGAGKDTLLLGAREELTEADGVEFLRRHITRDASKVTELEVAVSPEDFAARKSAGDYALTWHAHGTDYGILAADLERGLGAKKWCLPRPPPAG